MAKKTANKKAKTKKTIDVSNVDAIMEDMKKLALEKPVEEKVEIEEKNETKVEVKCLDDAVYGTGIVKKPEKVENNTDTDIKDVDIVTTQSPQNEIEETTTVEQNVEEQNEEDLSFIEKINNGELIVKEDNTKIEENPKNIENKPKRKSYSEMFGNTWCGYGYTY